MDCEIGCVGREEWDTSDNEKKESWNGVAYVGKTRNIIMPNKSVVAQITGSQLILGHESIYSDKAFVRNLALMNTFWPQTLSFQKAL